MSLYYSDLQDCGMILTVGGGWTQEFCLDQRFSGIVCLDQCKCESSNIYTWIIRCGEHARGPAEIASEGVSFSVK